MTRQNSKKQDEGISAFVGNVEEFLKTEAEEGVIARMTDTALIDRMALSTGVDEAAPIKVIFPLALEVKPRICMEMMLADREFGRQAHELAQWLMSGEEGSEPPPCDSESLRVAHAYADWMAGQKKDFIDHLNDIVDTSKSKDRSEAVRSIGAAA